MSDKLVVCLLVYCVIREFIFITTVHRLVNKLMSASFYDYQIAKSAGKIKEQPAPVVPIEPYPEDFGYLNEILS